MRLSSLAIDGTRLVGDGDVEIGGVSADSRTVRPGDLFAALPGGQQDGRSFAAEAVQRGAVAVLGAVGIAGAVPGVPVLESAEPRRALALIAAKLFGRQPATVVAVTGTNGKTSTVVFTRQLWRACGRTAGSLGTLGVQAPGIDRPGLLTTPDPVALHATLAELADAGVDHLAMEASSHGLDQRRLDGVQLAAAAFTNLTRDHYDYHGSPEAYFAAKRRLFRELLPPGAVAVLNADVPEFAALSADARARGIEVVDYGRAASCLRIVEQELDAGGQVLTYARGGREMTVRLALVGAFQAWNALAALGLVIATGGDADVAGAAMSLLEGAPGRMKLATRLPNGAPVFVDYAHTPDSLEKALASLRAHTERRLHVVFGCGGDRDPGKRPLMGAIAHDLADVVYVTDDNPRTEEPAAIRRAVLAAAPGAIEIGDRAEAIATAMATLQPGDVLLVAGKGHERGQTIGTRTLPFDDVEVCRAAAAALRERAA